MSDVFLSMADFSRFTDRLYENLMLLHARVNYLRTCSRESIEYWTFYDAILAQVRAMFMEKAKHKDNITVQVFLRKIGAEDAVEEINDYFKQEIYDGITIQEGILRSVDKFIVHYDPLTEDDLRVEKICSENLTDSSSPFFIGKIIEETLLYMVAAQAEKFMNGITFLDDIDDDEENEDDEE